MLFVDIIYLIAIGIYLFYTLLMIYSFMRELNNHYPEPDIHTLPPVSILKPLKGLDDQLEQNLRSFFQLDYPKFEILFGISDGNDPAVKIVRELQRAYPNVSTKLIIDNTRIGLNPKINNLFNIQAFAKYSHILISDSNVRVHSGYLTSMMKYLNLPGTGLVTSSIRGVGAKSLGAIFENLHLNSFITPSVYAVRKAINLPISIGKSMLLRSETLSQIGGFYHFRNVLAEDHLIGQSVRELGLETQTSPDAINNVNQYWSIKKFINRHLRWGQMRRNINEFYYMIELFSHPFFLSIVYLLIRQDVFALLALGVVLLLKISLDLMLNLLIGSDGRWYHYFLIPVKDLIVAFVWFIPYFNRTVNWRGNVYKIEKNTYLIPQMKGA